MVLTGVTLNLTVLGHMSFRSQYQWVWVTIVCRPSAPSCLHGVIAFYKPETPSKPEATARNLATPFSQQAVGTLFIL